MIFYIVSVKNRIQEHTDVPEGENPFKDSITFEKEKTECSLVYTAVKITHLITVQYLMHCSGEVAQWPCNVVPGRGCPCQPQIIFPKFRCGIRVHVMIRGLGRSADSAVDPFTQVRCAKMQRIPYPLD